MTSPISPPAATATAQPPLVSIVVPLLNEEGNLRELHRRLVLTLDAAGVRREILFVDDGSTDGSAAVMAELAAADPTVVGLRLSRNFGHEAASTCGLDRARGDAAVLMDADLQDPPELIAEMLDKWRAGKEVVYAVRRRRAGETAFKRFTAAVFYRALNAMSDVPIPRDTGDFRLVDAKVLRALAGCREQDRFVRGLVAWTGFRTDHVTYDRPARHAGWTKYNPLKLLLLSLDALVGYSITPLRLSTWIGFVVTVLSVVLGLTVVVQRLFFPGVITQSGYALLVSGMFFLGGVQMLMLGIMGEYVGRTYREAQRRPLYLVAEQLGGPAAAAPAGGDGSPGGARHA